MKRLLVTLLVLSMGIGIVSCQRGHYRLVPVESVATPKASEESKAPQWTLTELKWTPATDSSWTVSGLAFHNEDPTKWQRFPDRVKETIRPAVWRLSEMPSGGRIRFQSDTGALALRVSYPLLPNMRNMHAFGQSGIDVYVDGGYKASLAPAKDLNVEAYLFKGLPKEMREYTVYLPLYMGVTVHEIGVTTDSVVLPPSEFAVEKPVVFYGTSITQGGCASRSGMSYQAILSRRMNIDFVNFGFSGNGRGEKEVADVIAEVDASCFVIDMAQNNKTAEELATNLTPFLDTIRAAHPDTPILITTPIYAATEYPWFEAEKILPAMRDVIRAEKNRRVQAGDKNFFLVEGFTLIGPGQADAFVDGVHPNDLGFQWMADALEPHLRKILNLPK